MKEYNGEVPYELSVRHWLRNYEMVFRLGEAAACKYGIPAIPSTGGAAVWNMVNSHYKLVKGTGIEWEKRLKPLVDRKVFFVRSYMNPLSKRIITFNPAYKPHRWKRITCS